MWRTLTSLFLAALIAGSGQIALTTGHLDSAIAWLALPGWYVSLLLGFEGHGGHSAAAPYVQFVLNLTIYFSLALVVLSLVPQRKPASKGTRS